MDINDIARLRENRAISELIQLLSDDNIEIRKDAVYALGALKAKEAVMALVPLLGDSDPHVRLQASRSLGNICDPRAVEGLITTLTDNEDYVRWNSAEALGKIGDPRAIEPLIAALKDRNKLVRKDAAKALAGFTETKAVEALQNYEQTKEGRADNAPSMSSNEISYFPKRMNVAMKPQIKTNKPIYLQFYLKLVIIGLSTYLVSTLCIYFFARITGFDVEEPYKIYRGVGYFLAIAGAISANACGRHTRRIFGKRITPLVIGAILTTWMIGLFVWFGYFLFEAYYFPDVGNEPAGIFLWATLCMVGWAPIMEN